MFMIQMHRERGIIVVVFIQKLLVEPRCVRVHGPGPVYVTEDRWCNLI
jgi:hypothetical protein